MIQEIEARERESEGERERKRETETERAGEKQHNPRCNRRLHTTTQFTVQMYFYFVLFFSFIIKKSVKAPCQLLQEVHFHKKLQQQ